MKLKRPASPATTANLPLSLGLRRYLYLTAAVTGAAIMIVEILGAKMLAPYLGTSHFVWTAQITVTLLALACGYYAGGRWVDRAPRLGRLYGAVVAVWTALVLLPGVLAVQSLGGGIRVRVEARSLDAVLAAARRADPDVTIEAADPTLDDVFLAVVAEGER